MERRCQINDFLLIQCIFGRGVRTVPTVDCKSWRKQHEAIESAQVGSDEPRFIDDSKSTVGNGECVEVAGCVNTGVGYP